MIQAPVLTFTDVRRIYTEAKAPSKIL